MSDDSDNSLVSRAAIATGAAVGSAAIAAALLFVKRRNARKKAAAQPPATGKAPTADEIAEGKEAISDPDSPFSPHATD
jgi:Na+/H+-translocating membrane pyrophosphatase